MGPADLYLENLELIQRVISAACAKHHVWGADADDFRSEVHIHLMKGDYAALRSYKGDSKLATFLTACVAHKFQDWRNGEWGKWRPSAAARREGKHAEILEMLIVRDKLSIEQACQTLRSKFAPTLSESALLALAARLPLRPRRSFFGETELADHAAPHGHADDGLRRSEGTALARRALAALTSALEALRPQDRLILQLKYSDCTKVSDIARALQINQRRLYRRIEQLELDLREALTTRGLTKDDVSYLIDVRGIDGLED